ncbi:hypothetical protein GCM10027592_03600 [Spirosoma flavus]
MPSEDRKRLAHLLSFEKAGFQLIIFYLTGALFIKGGFTYWSMNEQIERGILPLSTILLYPQNVAIKHSNGHMIDVFILVSRVP